MKTAYLSLKKDVIRNIEHKNDKNDENCKNYERDKETSQILFFLNNSFSIKGILFPTYELAEKDQLQTLGVLQVGILFIDVEEYNRILTKEILETYVMEQADNIVGTIYPDGD